MAERATGRPWTAEEDELLQRAVANHGENDMWKTIALSIPGRTNKACRKRWLHSLSPTVKKTPWTKEEDALLLSLYAAHGIKWALIARSIPGRTDDACSKRYREALDPSLKKDEWTPEEDDRLLGVYARIGGKWGHIGQELQRSGLSCRNRWRLLQRKQSKATAAQTGDVSTSPYVQPWQMPMLDVSDYWAAQFQQYDPDLNLISREYQPYPDDNQGSDLGGSSFTPSDLSTSPNVSPADGVLYQPSSSLADAFNPPDGHLRTNFTPSESSIPTSVGYSSPAETYQLPARESHCRSTPHVDSVGNQDPGPSSSSYNADVSRAQAPDFATSSWNEDATTAFDVNLGDLPSQTEVDSGNSQPVVPPTMARSHEEIISITSPSDIPHSAADDFSTSVDLSAYRMTRPPSGSRPPKRPRDPEAPPQRLSATLAVSSDPAVKPYACGHPSCWLSEANTGLSCFMTSGELVEHGRAAHPDDMTASPKPYKCALEGCGKGWTSVNGLQYHLQISKTHFRQALNSVTEHGQAPGRNTLDGEVVPDADQQRPAKKRKVHPCPHPDCPNEYKQLSGLRYHLTHAHAHVLPTQLQVIPPTLARKVTKG